MKKVAFLGSSSALKPKIIIETLLNNSLSYDLEIICITNNDKGCFVDYCRRKKIRIIIIDQDIIESIINSKTKIELLVSVGWPKKISNEVLKYFNYKVINCHGSFLPDYRGSRAYMHYWANYEKYFGATIHYINEKFDDGNILIQQKLKLLDSDTPQTLHYRTSELCAILLPIAIGEVFQKNPGFPGVGVKRYFKSLTHEEFVKYRIINESRCEELRILTPHKIVKE